MRTHTSMRAAVAGTATLALAGFLALAGCSAASAAQGPQGGSGDVPGTGKASAAAGSRDDGAADATPQGRANASQDGTAVTATKGGVEYPGGDTTGKLPAAKEWELVDQYGKAHALADLRGKVVFLNFWTTWCPYCVTEMPDIQELYEQYGANEGDVVIMGVANPATPEHPQNADEPLDTIMDFLDEKGVTYPILIDDTGDVFDDYKVYYLPTTYMIDPYGNVFGYVTGGMDRERLERIIESALAGDLDRGMGL